MLEVIEKETELPIEVYSIRDDNNGYPTKEKTVMLLSKEKQPLKTLNMKELLRLSDDKFHTMVSDDIDRKKFLKQVITDWYKNNIKSNGILSVNHL